MTERTHNALVSFIVRTEGRRASLLSGALASIGAQSYPAIEAIVVEDGDGDAGVVVDAANTSRPGVFTHKPIAKAGRCAAGNAGLEAARGEFIGFLDEDDELYVEHVQLLLQALQQAPHYRLAYGRAHVEFCEGLVEDRVTAKKRLPHVTAFPFSRTKLWLQNQFPIQAALFRRSLYEEKGGLDPSLDYFEDWDLWLRYSADEDFLAVDALTSLYRMPAEKKELREREARHEEYFAALLAKHKLLEGRHRFGEINALPAEAQMSLPFRRAAAIAGGAFLRRIGDIMKGRS